MVGEKASSLAGASGRAWGSLSADGTKGYVLFKRALVFNCQEKIQWPQSRRITYRALHGKPVDRTLLIHII